MNMIKMISFWGEPQGIYNPEASSNSGDYWQFTGGALFASEDGLYIILDIDDQSCGDFGYRRFCTFTAQTAAKAAEWHIHRRRLRHAGRRAHECLLGRLS